jgi:AraC family transcriptional activator of mtrCDE
MDTLSHLLTLYPVRTALDVRCHYGAPWVLDQPASPDGVAPYHLIARGSALVDGADGFELQAGDIIVFPHGGAHRLYSGDPAQASPVHKEAGQLRFESNGGDGPATDILCGEFRFDAPASASLLLALPEVMVISTRGRADFQGLRALLDLLRAEADSAGAGNSVVVGHLASALFALIMRAWIERPGEVPGLFGLLAEPRLRAAVDAMLSCPQQAWTVERMASLCHMSRATFARAFVRAAGAAPATVLAHLRMARAARALTQNRRSAAEIGEDVGYQSEAAFSRSFKRIYGVGPGEYRRNATRLAAAPAAAGTILAR